MVKRATIADVARVAGVSRATASRALNDSPQVTDVTKEKVRAAVQETGFVMNRLGRALAVGRSETIAILVTEPLDEFFSDPTFLTVLRGVNDGLAETSTMPVLLQAWSESEHRRALRHFERRSFDAVISISPYVGGDMLEALQEGTLPVVLCGQVEGHPYVGVFGNVYADDVAGAQLAGTRMMERGRRRIAIINGPQDNPAAVDRLLGYRAAMGGTFDPELAVWTGWDEASGFESMRSLLEREPQIDGVLAASDRIAAGALQALSLGGKNVPADVSLIGFDDHNLATAVTPALTTVRQPLNQEGRLAAETALDMIAGAPARTIVLDMELIERDSV
ncbi:LacI family DNA-binding transcriptional regulator [Tessaracoccus massiliensis]|uniref:LacI family DNA-binding transcriptional regulator n=1 Tax=Tessaracoccus massiliensis TaxID=1522311 RepID=UPI00058F317C|nr:LacI family DNA-binding transcriptional regulator [Tessaracoccus massiliensis]